MTVQTKEKNLYILTEERPKEDTIITILKEFSTDYQNKLVYKRGKEKLTIKPIIRKKKFQHYYEIHDVKLEGVKRIILKIVSGESSFVDYLVYYENNEPNQKKDSPIYVIEETKTTPAESRNLHYQRIIKYGYLSYYPKINKARKLFIYSIRKNFSTIPKSFVMGTRMLKSQNVKILGLQNTIVNIDDTRYRKFSDLDEMIKFKKSFAKKIGASKDIPLLITKKLDTVSISAKLMKPSRNKKTSKVTESWSDPSTGFAASCCFIIRNIFKFKGKIKITNHGFTEDPSSGSANGKFLKIADRLDVAIGKWSVPKKSLPDKYYKKSETEKIVSIFLHLACEMNNDLIPIYENHAGSEQGYFEERCRRCFRNMGTDSFHVVEKVGELKPDLVLLDKTKKEILILEAEVAKNVIGPKKGVNQLSGFKKFEDNLCKTYYPNYTCKRFVVLFGDDVFPKKIQKSEKNKVIFRLKKDGEMIFYDKCPQSIKDVISKLKK